jgi:hypothetical protein
MSVYGDLLAYFPELIKIHQIFSMKPKVGGGYEERVPIRKIRAAFIREGQSKMKMQGEARVANEAGVLYCFDHVDRGILDQGTYFEDDGQIMLIMNDQTFAREGGFSAYGVQLVAGLTDKQVENKQVTTNIIGDYQ